MKWLLEATGWAGSAMLVWSLLQTRIMRLRALNLVGCLVLIVYNGALKVWPMVGLNVVLAIINIVYLRKLLSTRHDENAYSVVPVDGAFLQHVLDTHGQDIQLFNPGFARHDDESAYVVMRGDDLAGLVLFQQRGEVAHVTLDYVTQRFRDFSPGEFVFKRSGLFTSRGIRTILTPAGMVDPYYPKLGFTPDGDHYRLDLPTVH